MYKNRSHDGSANICGKKIRAWRKETRPLMSQRELAQKLQLEGIDLDKNAIQRIESGKRFVTDLELKAFAKILGIPADELLE